MRKSNRKFLRFYEEINKYTDGIHILHKGIDAKVVEHFEKEYGLYLPSNYKDFLIQNNGGELFATPAGTSFAGILGNSVREKGVFYLEDNFNRVKRLQIPNYVLIIGETCEGNIIGYDLTRTNLIDGVVVYWNHEIGEVEDEWDCLEEWLEDEMETGKMYINYDGTDNDEI